MCRCLRYIRFMRRVASTGHKASAPISEEYADIPAPHVGLVANSHAMFARQGYDRPRMIPKFRPTRAIPHRTSHPAGCRKTAVCGRYPLELLIRRMDEYATYR